MALVALKVGSATISSPGMERTTSSSVAPHVSAHGRYTCQTRGGAADKAGLEGSFVRRGQVYLGDIITKINNKPVKNYNEYMNELEKYNVGDKVNITIIRNNRKKVLNITLEQVE